MSEFLLPESVEKLRIAMIAINDSMIAILQSLEPVCQNITQAGKSFYSAGYNLYLKNGAKYGENHEGMMRWYEELPKK